MATLTLSAALMFILRHSPATPADDRSDSEDIPDEKLPLYLHRAIWYVSGSLAIIMLSTISLALLDRPLDKPGTLRLSNRYVRLSGRAVYSLIVVLIPLQNNLKPGLFLGTCSLLLMALSVFEFVVSAQKGGAIFESKRLAPETSDTR